MVKTIKFIMIGEPKELKPDQAADPYPAPADHNILLAWYCWSVLLLRVCLMGLWCDGGA